MKNLVLTENEPKAFETAMHDEMSLAIKHLERELVKIRTGRAHTSLVEDILVTCYGGSPMPLKQVASLAAPDVRLITIQPWDKGVLGDIERAINSSQVGIKPLNDGDMIKLVLPEMSTSRRDELTKILGKKVEECKVAIRNVRKEFNNFIRDAKKDKKISENFFNRLSDILQKITDTYVESADKLGTKKEQEIKAV
jgi:ribosome recycling factor